MKLNDGRELVVIKTDTFFDFPSIEGVLVVVIPFDVELLAGNTAYQQLIKHRDYLNEIIDEIKLDNLVQEIMRGD